MVSTISAAIADTRRWSFKSEISSTGKSSEVLQPSVNIIDEHPDYASPYLRRDDGLEGLDFALDPRSATPEPVRRDTAPTTAMPSMPRRAATPPPAARYAPMPVATRTPPDSKPPSLRSARRKHTTASHQSLSDDVSQQESRSLRDTAFVHALHVFHFGISTS